MNAVPAPAAAAIEVTAADLEGSGVIFCPNPKMPLWSNHPRVFLDVVAKGEARCPYCGTAYKLAEGQTVHRH